MVSMVTSERVVGFRQAQREWELVTPMFKDILLRTDLRGRTVIDAGSGEGRLAFFIAPNVGRVVAIDYDEKALWKARQYADMKGIRNVDFVLADIEKEAFHTIWDGPVDAIVASFYMSEALLWRASSVLPVGTPFMFCCHHEDHWLETGQPSRHTYSEEDIRDLLMEDFFDLEFIGNEKHVVQFVSIEEVELFIGGRLLKKWVERGAWDNVVESFRRGKRQLTLSYLVGKARRGPGSH